MSQYRAADELNTNSRFAPFPRSLCSWGLLSSGLGLCSATAMGCLKLLWEGAFSTQFAWAALVAMLLGVGLIASGFVMVADWQDPFAGDDRLPEVRTFPEDHDRSTLEDKNLWTTSRSAAVSEQQAPRAAGPLESSRT